MTTIRRGESLMGATKVLHARVAAAQQLHTRDVPSPWVLTVAITCDLGGMPELKSAYGA